MKKIECSIPTSWKDVRDFFYYRGFTKRAKHNNQVLNDLKMEICNEINSGYWNPDISDYMRSQIIPKINEMFHRARMKLK